MNTKCLVCDKETETKFEETRCYDVVIQIKEKKFFLHYSCFHELSAIMIEMIRSGRKNGY